MRKLRLISLLSLSIVLVAVACTKEGPEGPAGAAGTQGAAGNPGPQGPAGPQGPQGTTTVIYSAWFNFAAADWADSIGMGLFGDVSRAIRTAPGVTQTVLDQGIVLAYTNLGGVHLLPLNIPNPFFSSETLQLGAIASLGKLTFYLADLIFPDATGITFTAPLRYVIIPGSIAGGRGINGVTTYEGYTENELKAMSYEQIRTTFNIPADGTNIR